MKFSGRLKVAFCSVFISYSLIFAGGFNNLGYGARAVSLGDMYVAISDEPYAVFYNPAGIGQIDELMLSSTYSKLYPFVVGDNLYYGSLSGSLPLFSIVNFGVGITFFRSNMWNESQFAFSAGRRIISGLLIGGSLRLLRWSSSPPPGEGSYSYFGFTFDVGALFVWRNFTDGSDLKIGFSVMNLNRPSIAKSGSNDARLPLEFEAGFAYMSNNYNYLIGAGVRRSGESIRVSIGMEILAFSSGLLGDEIAFIIRGSVGEMISGSKQGDLNFGFGLKYWKLWIDYTYVHQVEIADAGGNHKITISYRF